MLGKILSPEERAAYEEAVERGLKVPPPVSLYDLPATYRDIARTKQLPPDTPGYAEALLELGQESMVRYVVDPGNSHTKPKTVPINEAPPEALQNFFLWFIMAGRGFGKTWVGANWINEGAKRATGEYMAILGRDAHDVRAYCVEGESGILAKAPSDFYPAYEPSKRLLTYPNGVKAQLFYAEEPDAVRGPNCFRAWADEPASYKDAAYGMNSEVGKATAMSNLLMVLRKGDPQLLVTGTPKPLALIKELLRWRGAILVNGVMYENTDLSPKWMEIMEGKYAGTRLGRQELDGQVLDDNPGALWNRTMIDPYRVESVHDVQLVYVAIDPQASAAAGTTGIMVVARKKEGNKKWRYYLLEDASVSGPPEVWAKKALDKYEQYGANKIIAEKNNGGDMVEAVIKNIDPNAKYESVWASRGKRIRAEPVSVLYEKGLVHHVGSPTQYLQLEDQLCTWEPGDDSPDRLDALVWGLTALADAGNAYSWGYGK
jgi:phage terminase large subunit-like protein